MSLHPHCVTCGLPATHACKNCPLEKFYCSSECFWNDLHSSWCSCSAGASAGPVDRLIGQETREIEEEKSPKEIMQYYKAMKNWEWKDHKGDLEFAAFRRKIVNAILKEVILRHGCHKCSVLSVGSTSPTSDYDLTVMGPKAAQVVDAFNRRFRQLFGRKESATVFDTNVYGASFVEPLDLGNFSVFTLQTVPPMHFAYVADAHDEQQQRTWALLKVYMFLQEGEEKRIFLEKYPWVKEKKTKLDAELGIPREKADIKRLNKAYVKSLYKVARLKAVMAETTAVDPRLRRRYKEAICVSNYFGSEMYFTQGAFLHVVGELQGGFKGFPITPDEYGDSFVENLGDCLKELLYASDKVLDCDETINHISKYFSRAMHALFREDRPEHQNKQSLYLALYKASDAVRLKVRGKDQGPEVLSLDLLRRQFRELLKLEKCQDLRGRILQILYTSDI